MHKDSKIFVAGHRGLVGSALVKRLKYGGFHHLVTRTHEELDLIDQQATESFFQEEKPEMVFLAAAKVGGIQANNAYPGEFIYENLMIANNVIHSAFRSETEKLLFLGSSCIYPKFAEQPIKESYILQGELEPTNAPYAVAKIAGIKLCSSYRRQYGKQFFGVMPTNLYGPNDHYDLEKAHVLPALIRKFHEAKLFNAPHVTLWGTGKPRREFMYSEDLADACIHLSSNVDPSEMGEFVNIGVGEDLTILELAELISEIVGYEGRLIQDTTKPDGTPQKKLDVSLLNKLGYQATTDLRSGIEKTYKDFITHYEERC